MASALAVATDGRLVDELRILGWTLPVIFVAAEASGSVTAGVQDRNGDGLLLKPFSLRELSETVDRLSAQHGI